MTPIKYVGVRAEYTDGTYGTRITFSHGETKMVPDEIARKMLRHPDVYVAGEGYATPDAAESVNAQKKQDDEQEQSLQDARDAVAAMDKDALKRFAKANFGQDLPGQMSEKNMRAKVVGLIDQYGLP